MRINLIASAIFAAIITSDAQEVRDRFPIVEVVYEVFSMERAEAAASQRKNLNDAKLYQDLIAGLKEGRTKQEKLVAIRTESEEVATAEHISELLYPTEFDPAELPNAVSLAVDVPASEKEDPPAEGVIDALRTGPGWSEGNFPATPSAGTSTQIGKLGDTLEIEPLVLDSTGKRIQVRFASEHVDLVNFESWGVGLAEAKMPIFSRRRILSSTEVDNGVPTLIGTVSPPGGGFDKEGEAEARKMVWFAFITATIVEPEE